MARTSQLIQLGKRKFELSNLDKLLFPEDHILKAELIQYYLKIAPTILNHIKGRPLSLVRFPDGITGEKFFQKNRPNWAPDWVEYIPLGSEEKKDYILATEEATLVWLANLACIELHQIHARKPHFDKPDYIVFDLDPPKEFSFPQVVEVAFELKEHIETFGYTPFTKTTGRKGIHIVIPIEPKWDFRKIAKAAEQIAKPFVNKHKNITTLQIRKEARKNKILVDIFRNRSSQTIVSPYSVRGLPGAPVSIPLHWEQLAEMQSISEMNIHTALEQVLNEGDAWETINAYAVSLHTERKIVTTQSKTQKEEIPDSLQVYSKKRSFSVTPEPKPEDFLGEGNSFVIHRHHASRLHYDLRLEQDGTLKSWAVPKGLPQRPGVKRLAVEVEDHPLKYLTFQGTIPKGQYGAGNMWIYAIGKYEITKEKKTGFYFRLQSREINAEYRIHRMKDKDWLLERVDNPQIDYLVDPIEPMLAVIKKVPPESDNYIYEVKWDGIRALISLDEGQITIKSRNQKDLTKHFPELLILDRAFRATTGLFDGEIVCLDKKSKPVFRDVIHRMQQSTEGGIERGRIKKPAVCYLFDCLYLDGRPLVNEPLLRRKEWLADSIRNDTPYRISEDVEEGKELFQAAAQLGLEGIMAKEKTSPYLRGKRSDYWYKIKVRQSTECVIIGYTTGKGDREKYFGALQLAKQKENELTYVGRVGTGFDEKLLKSIYTELQKIDKFQEPPIEGTDEDPGTTWLEPQLICDIQYASITKNGTLREPVFLRLRPDLVFNRKKSDL